MNQNEDRGREVALIVAEEARSELHAALSHLATARGELHDMSTVAYRRELSWRQMQRSLHLKPRLAQSGK